MHRHPQLPPRVVHAVHLLDALRQNEAWAPGLHRPVLASNGAKMGTLRAQLDFLFDHASAQGADHAGEPLVVVDGTVGTRTPEREHQLMRVRGVRKQIAGVGICRPAFVCIEVDAGRSEQRRKQSLGGRKNPRGRRSGTHLAGNRAVEGKERRRVVVDGNHHFIEYHAPHAGVVSEEPER